MSEGDQTAEETPGLRMRRYRIKAAMTLHDLSTRTGIVDSTLYLIEMDRKVPPADALHGIAGALGVTMDDIWSGEAARKRQKILSARIIGVVAAAENLCRVAETGDTIPAELAEAVTALSERVKKFRVKRVPKTPTTVAPADQPLQDFEDEVVARLHPTHRSFRATIVGVRLIGNAAWAEVAYRPEEGEMTGRPGRTLIEPLEWPGGMWPPRRGDVVHVDYRPRFVGFERRG